MHKPTVNELADLLYALAEDERLVSALERGFTDLEITDMLCQLEYACEKIGY